MPTQAPSKFQLFRGDTLLGIITHDPQQDDWPWQRGNFVAEDGFASVKHLFEKELLLMRERRYQEFDDIWEEIEAVGLRMQMLETGETFSVGLIHIDGTRASWRTMRPNSAPEPTVVSF